MRKPLETFCRYSNGYGNGLLRAGRVAEDCDAVHIKTQELFDEAAADVSPDYWLWDGVHPLPQGHELIARHWLHEVSARWPLGR